MSITGTLKEHYPNYYSGDQSLSQWRRLGAIDKARSIMELCASLSHDEILEIGCGDGAVLEQPSGNEFGSQLAGIEISPSAVCSAQQKADTQLSDQLFLTETVSHLKIRSSILQFLSMSWNMSNTREKFYEAARVAKCVFIEVPLEDNATLPDDYVFDPVGHINF